jgi:hypothetical protein
MKLTITMKNTKDRSEFEKTFLANYAQLSKIIDLRSKIGDGNRIFSAANPGHPVINLGELVNLDQRGSRLDERTGRTVYYTLHDILRNGKILNEYAVLILGPNGTSGHGKTQFAQAAACHWALANTAAMGRKPEEAKYIMANTIDELNMVNPPISKGQVLVLDEFKPADDVAQIYMSEDILKCLLTPMAPGTVRARNVNTVIAQGAPRIITANAKSLED